MKTVSIPTNVMGAFNSASGSVEMGDAMVWRRAYVPQWLPVPERRPARKGAPPAVAPPKTSIWIAPQSEPLAERLLLGLLVVAAAASIAYGLWQVLNLVQNWAAVNAAMAQVIQ